MGSKLHIALHILGTEHMSACGLDYWRYSGSIADHFVFQLRPHFICHNYSERAIFG